MSRDTLIIALVMMTLLLAVLVAVWQLYRVKQSQKRHGDPDGDKATRDALDHSPDEQTITR